MVRRLTAGGEGLEPLVPREKERAFRDHLDRPPAPSPPREATFLARGTLSSNPSPFKRGVRCEPVSATEQGCHPYYPRGSDDGLRRVRAGTLDDTSWLRPTA